MAKDYIRLIDNEPIIEVYLKPVAAYADALKANGEPVPAPIKVAALIDCGFTGGFMISEAVIKHWKLKRRGWCEIGIMRDNETRYYSQYAWNVDIAVKFPGCSHDGGNVLIESFATQVEFVNSKNSQVLVGQQLLQKAVFVMNGPKNSFSLKFPKQP